ncbi:hypothetical protein [Allosphingosinicella indica]|uniref:Uncharacterized protein n=1 Tax=Allosphingosinicella indica TaxID=941907 RepID=A0A1X7GHH8_9SPHN|nr:hypothetical protein [Allosphingosinicella indica]SMF69461.1 hypothetical protein SAMN06295910_1731 [Allosphingosinicella indica]
MKVGLGLVAAALLLAGCEAKIGKDAENAKADASAEAGEGSFSVDVPGFQMKVAIPENIRNNTTFSDDGGLLYPGAAVKGVNIQARVDANKGVQINFSTSDGPEAVNAWYRDPARDKYAIVSDRSEGGSTVIEAAEKAGNDLYTIRLTPRPSGGTDGAIHIRDKG